jgi:hypothetical protein
MARDYAVVLRVENLDVYELIGDKGYGRVPEKVRQVLTLRRSMLEDEDEMARQLAGMYGTEEDHLAVAVAILSALVRAVKPQPGVGERLDIGRGRRPWYQKRWTGWGKG